MADSLAAASAAAAALPFAPDEPLDVVLSRWCETLRVANRALAPHVDRAHVAVLSANPAMTDAVEALVALQRCEAETQGRLAALRAVLLLPQVPTVFAPPAVEAELTAQTLRRFARESLGVAAYGRRSSSAPRPTIDDACALALRRAEAREWESLHLASRFTAQDATTRVLDESFELLVDASEHAHTESLCRKWRRVRLTGAARHVVCLEFKDPAARGPKGECVVCGRECAGFRAIVPRAPFHLVCAAFVLGTRKETENGDECA